MRSVARLAALGSAFTLAACAVIAGLDDPSAVDGSSSGSSSSGSLQDTGNGSSSGGSSGSSGSTASDSSSDGASSSGSPGDAQPDVATCPLQKNGDNCNAHSQCCSSKCNELRQCANGCSPAGMFNCDPTSDDDCCIGLYCSFGSCTQCILAGQPPASPGGVPNPRSCCGRSINVANGTCN